MEYDKPAFMCVIDITKAFDCIKLKDILNILKANKIPEDLNKKNSSAVRQKQKYPSMIP